MKAPCKGCEERKVGCHNDCEAYKTWLDEYHKAKQVRDKNAFLDYECRSYIINDIRTKRRQRKKR